MISFKKEEIGRFWSKVGITTDPTACWEWLASRGNHGYGYARMEKKTWRAHRLAWAIANERAPQLNVLHSCDNPPCCNPNHLREGTQKENIQECVSKGRFHGKLSIEIARAIRSRFAEGGVAKRALGREYGISLAEVRRILNNESWEEKTNE